MLSEYIRQLKGMGLYDNTAILVTSDHGDWGIYEDWDSSSNAIMFYKPAQSAEADAQPIKTVSNAGRARERTADHHPGCWRRLVQVR